MTDKKPLDDWIFLIGSWGGGSEDQFGDEGRIDTTAEFTSKLGGEYIMGVIESERDGSLENASIIMMFYDARNKVFRRKTFFSYGFVNNEVEYERSENEIRFEVESEPTPQAFDGMRWRSYIQRVSDMEIRMGLEAAKEGEDFKCYGETILKKEEG